MLKIFFNWFNYVKIYRFNVPVDRIMATGRAIGGGGGGGSIELG